MDVGRLGELIERLAEGGEGVTIRPVRQGSPMGGWGTQHRYEFDGWEAGSLTAGSGGELAVGTTVAGAVEAALNALDADDKD